MLFTPDEVHHLPIVLSAPRFATYLAERNGNAEEALKLYRWNLELSSAFLIPLPICEIAIRNSIVAAIEKTYGANWPWDAGFEISLRNPPSAYSPRRDLVSLRYLPSSGKVVAELKFIFWKKMLTRSHDGAIWNAHFRTVFPNTDRTRTVQSLRAEGYDSLFRIRDLRNRIAHHEPIFRRNPSEEYDRIRKVVSWANRAAAAWMDKIETVTPMAALKP